MKTALYCTPLHTTTAHYYCTLLLQNDVGRVTLLLNGKQVAAGELPAPPNGEKENLRADCALFVLPNVESFRATEIRVWALAR